MMARLEKPPALGRDGLPFIIEVFRKNTGPGLKKFLFKKLDNYFCPVAVASRGANCMKLKKALQQMHMRVLEKSRIGIGQAAEIAAGLCGHAGIDKGKRPVSVIKILL